MVLPNQRNTSIKIEDPVPLEIETSAFQNVMQQMNIANKEGFEKYSSSLWQDASVKNESLTVLICEIDCFRDYADNYGIQSASFMLVVVGLALKKVCDVNDCFLSHFEDGHFGALIKNIDKDKALNFAELLRTTIEKTQTEHKHSSISDIVTLSVGISRCYPTSTVSLMNSSMEQLVIAQSSGGHQVKSLFSQPIDIEENIKVESESEIEVEVESEIEVINEELVEENPNTEDLDPRVAKKNNKTVFLDPHIINKHSEVVENKKENKAVFLDPYITKENLELKVENSEDNSANTKEVSVPTFSAFNAIKLNDEVTETKKELSSSVVIDTSSTTNELNETKLNEPEIVEDANLSNSNEVEKAEDVIPDESNQLENTNQTTLNEEQKDESSDIELESPIDQTSLKQFMLDVNITSLEDFETDYGRLWQECVEEYEMLSMLICKIDFFEQYIDSYGDHASEDLLFIVASVLNLVCEKYGGLGYYAGANEFIMLIKGGNATKALRSAKYLHELLKESDTEHNQSEINHLVTLSSGLSSVFPDSMNTMSMFKDIVEDAVSVAVLEGRNRTSIS